MDSPDDTTPEFTALHEAMPGIWQWLALRRIAQSPCHGYELIRFFERIGWAGGPAASALYPYLAKYLAEGMLTVKQRGRRKIYEITSAGEEHLRATGHHPYFERAFMAAQAPLAVEEATFSEAAAHVAAAVDALKERGTAKEQQRAAAILFRTAEALRRASAGTAKVAGAGA